MKKSVGGIWVNYWLLKISMKTDKTGKTEDNSWHLMLNVKPISRNMSLNYHFTESSIDQSKKVLKEDFLVLIAQLMIIALVQAISSTGGQEDELMK